MALRVFGLALKVGEKGVALRVGEKSASQFTPLHSPVYTHMSSSLSFKILNIENKLESRLRDIGVPWQLLRFCR